MSGQLVATTSLSDGAAGATAQGEGSTMGNNATTIGANNDSGHGGGNDGPSMLSAGQDAPADLEEWFPNGLYIYHTFLVIHVVAFLYVGLPSRGPHF